MNILIDAKIVRETEKALLISVYASRQNGNRYTKEVWFPKSQIEVSEEGIRASDWILDQKDRDIESTSKSAEAYKTQKEDAKAQFAAGKARAQAARQAQFAKVAK